MVQLTNLQALLVRSTNKPFYAILLFKLGEHGVGRDFLRDILPRVTSGTPAEVPEAPIINVSLSWRAIAATVKGHAGLDSAIGRRQFEPFFTDPEQGPGSLALASQLGFTGASSPDRWWDGFRSDDIDIAIYIASNSKDQRQDTEADIRQAAQRAGVGELSASGFPSGAIEGYLPPRGRLHFGYRDGITSMDVDWTDTGAPSTVNFREFVMGYPTADYPTTPYPDGPWRDFARDGSFACLTWIYQDVAGFESFLEQSAPELTSVAVGANPKEWLAAQLVGRWREGSPVALYPDAPPPLTDITSGFGYRNDPNGAHCPLGAHIRVAFSRDQPLNFANASRFPKGPPRLIRRGFSYGEPLAGPVDDGKDRGLCGIFLCARVNEQFYSVLRWMQGTAFSDVFDGATPGRTGQDRLLGSRLPAGSNVSPDPTMTVGPSDQPIKLSLRPFIQYKGVAVLFLPSMATLRNILAA